MIIRFKIHMYIRMSIIIHIRIGIGIRINIRINTAVEHPVGSGRPLAAPPREWALTIPPSVVVIVIASPSGHPPTLH